MKRVYLRKSQRRIPWFKIFICGLAVFATVNTIIATSQALTPSNSANDWVTYISKSTLDTQFFRTNAVPFSISSWLFIFGALIWRGRLKSRWIKGGFTRDIFNLFVLMRGSSTRISLLAALTEPKDRNQLSKEIGQDWVAVDRQIRILVRFKLVHETAVYGKVKFYRISTTGRNLLNLVGQLRSRENSNDIAAE